MKIHFWVTPNGASNKTEYENLQFSTNNSLYLENDTRHGQQDIIGSYYKREEEKVWKLEKGKINRGMGGVQEE